MGAEHDDWTEVCEKRTCTSCAQNGADEECMNCGGEVEYIHWQSYPTLQEALDNVAFRLQFPELFE